VNRRYSESARLLEFALEMGQRVVGSVGEMLPDEAKRHLLNAQREVIQALVIVYEQQAGTRREARRQAPSDLGDEDVVVRSPRSRRKPGEAASSVRPVKVTPTTRPPRSTRIDVQ